MTILPVMHSRDYSSTFGLRNSAASDDDAAVGRAAVAMFRLDTDWASDDPTDAEVADRWGRWPDAMRDGYLCLAHAALEAAR